MEFKINEATPVNQTENSKPSAKKNLDDFQFTLKRLGNEGLSERIETLMADIRAQGDKIAHHMDIRDMRAYRALITEFINEIVANSYSFSRLNILDRRGRHKAYSLVKLIDKKLDELAQNLLNDEKSHIAILEKTGEIQGLLMDLLV